MEAAIGSMVGNGLAASSSFLVPSFLSRSIGSLENHVGIPSDQLRFLLVCLLAYPLAYVFSIIPGKNTKHLFSILTGIWIGNFLVSSQWIHTLVASLISYLILFILGPKGKIYGAAFAITYLAGLHIYRQWTAYLSWTFDVTMQMMIVVQKLTIVGFNLYDGTENKNPTEDQKKYSIQKLPNILEFLGWIYMPSNFAMGPTFEFVEYLKVVDGNFPRTNITPSLKVLLAAILYLGLNQVGSIYFSSDLLKNEEFLKSNPIYIHLVCLAVALVARFKYYFGFKVAEGAAIMAGFGHRVNPKSNEEDWEGMSNMDIKRFELSKSFRDSSTAWNIKTSLWLRRLVYDRVPTPFNLYAVYFLSAIWHGFYPGYYLFFLMIGLLTMVNRTIHQYLSPYFLQNPNRKFFYKIFSWTLTLISRDYFITSFILLSWGHCWNLFKAMGFWMHILGFLSFTICLVLPSKKGTSQKKPEKTQKVD